MFLGLSKTDVVKLSDIIRVEYDETMSTTFFHLSAGGFVSIEGRKFYDTYINFLTLSRNVLFMQDLIDRQDKVDKALEFHLSDSNNNPEIIVALDNVEELIKKVKEAKKHSMASKMEAMSKQMDLFDSIDVDTLN